MEEQAEAPTPRTEDEIVRSYWPTEMGEPAAWFRAAISDAMDYGIAFAVKRVNRLTSKDESE